jgi:hypothetical protein
MGSVAQGFVLHHHVDSLNGQHGSSTSEKDVDEKKIGRGNIGGRVFVRNLFTFSRGASLWCSPWDAMDVAPLVSDIHD